MAERRHHEWQQGDSRARRQRCNSARQNEAAAMGEFLTEQAFVGADRVLAVRLRRDGHRRKRWRKALRQIVQMGLHEERLRAEEQHQQKTDEGSSGSFAASGLLIVRYNPHKMFVRYRDCAAQRTSAVIFSLLRTPAFRPALCGPHSNLVLQNACADRRYFDL